MFHCISCLYHNMVDHNISIGGWKIKMLKMLGAVGELFLVSFLPFCDLENQIWVAKRCLYFPKKLKY